MVDRACLTRPPAPPGFLNLLTPSSAPSLAALFHAASAHGVAPFRALLLSCSRTPSPAPLPSCRQDEPAGHPTHPTEAGEDPRDQAAEAEWTQRERDSPGSLPAFRALLHTRVRHSSPGVTPCSERVALLGLCPPGCSPSAGMARASPRLPSWASLCRTRAAGRAALQGLGSSEVGLSLSRLPTLLGFGAS
jgi:hypothetical protein